MTSGEALRVVGEEGDGFCTLTADVSTVSLFAAKDFLKSRGRKENRNDRSTTSTTLPSRNPFELVLKMRGALFCAHSADAALANT